VFLFSSEEEYKRHFVPSDFEAHGETELYCGDEAQPTSSGELALSQDEGDHSESPLRSKESHGEDEVHPCYSDL